MILRSRIMISLLSVVAISGGVSALTGGYLLRRHLGQEAYNRVRQDLIAAHEFYQHRLAAMEGALYYTSLGERFSQAVAGKDLDYLSVRLDRVRNSANFDILSVTDTAGRVIYRAHRPSLSGDSLAEDQLISSVLQHEEVISGTMLVSIATLEKEEPSLAEQAKIRILPTPMAMPSETEITQLTAGMMLCSAVPVFDSNGKPAGVLRAGILLNRNYDLVDQVKNTVFHAEQYKGKPLGTATIFQNDVRISTNVLREDGSRAIGSRVSAEVYDYVLRQQGTWVDRAWVVNDWYIAAYAPIFDTEDRTIGMLYVGVVEGKFRDVTWNTLTIFGLLTFGGLLIATFIAWKLADSISRPVRSLDFASSAIAQGDFSHALTVQSKDEIGSLTQSFNIMARSLHERDERLKELTHLQLTRSEHLASIGRLAAGVAHEINNPLTGVLTFAYMLLKNAPEKSQEKKDIETIIAATTRCKEIIQGLLNFSRQNEPEKKLSDLNQVLGKALDLIRNQAHLNRIHIIEEMDSDLPLVFLDPNQIQEVAVNLMVNAMDAMPEGGKLYVCSRAYDEEGTPWAELKISDTGCGISDENLERIFDPFFTTKQAGTGTGLGLAVSYGIIAKHSGQINVSSEASQGAAVTVRLPIRLEEQGHE
jgi:two-component system, NtrC family, sensor kinase